MVFPEIALCDHHAHPFLRSPVLSSDFYRMYYTEGYHEPKNSRFLKSTVFFERTLRDLSELLTCDSDEESVLAARRKIDSMALFERIVAEQKIECVFVDDGFSNNDSAPLDEINRVVTAARVLRIESVLETCIKESRSLPELWDAITENANRLIPHSVALKSIIAYRSGLNIAIPGKKDVEEAFLRIKRDRISKPRKESKALLDAAFLYFCAESAHRGIPFQLHTGYGDHDIDLIESNPCLLRGLFEMPAYQGVPFILLHTGYPYCRETGYLSAIYPNVYTDLGLAIPYLSESGMRNVFEQLSELGPMNKCLYSSDAHFLPEWFYLSAKWAKSTVQKTLNRMHTEGEISERFAIETYIGIFNQNAKAVYKLDGQNASSSIKSHSESL